MTPEELESVSEIARRFVYANGGFSIVRIIGVEIDKPLDYSGMQKCRVRVACEYSASEIDQLAVEGLQHEESLKREFLKGAFYMILVIQGGKVLSSGWEGIDFY